jgi:hypothetical protein
VFYLLPSNAAVWRWNNGTASYDITHPGKAGTIALTSDLSSYLPLSGGTISGILIQGAPSSDSSITSMNRFQSDLFVQGNGSAPNTPTVAGFYLGKSTSDENRHLDIVSGADYSYIDFNKAGRTNNDYDVRLLVNVTTGLTEWHWGDNVSNKRMVVNGGLDVTGARIKCLPVWKNTCTYATNVYVGDTGMFTRTTTTSSRTIKHDIAELSSEELRADRLYSLGVVQFRYNDGIVTDRSDVRYGKALPGFIIEDMNQHYPIAIDKPSGNVAEWSWNEKYLIPPMLKLIQEQHQEDERLARELASTKAELQATNAKLDAVLMQLAELKKRIN